MLVIAQSKTEQQATKTREDGLGRPVHAAELAFEISPRGTPAAVNDSEATRELITQVCDRPCAQPAKCCFDGRFGVAEEICDLARGEFKPQELCALERGAGAEKPEDSAEDVRRREVDARAFGKLVPLLVGEFPSALSAVVPGLEIERTQARELLDAHGVSPQADDARRRGCHTRGRPPSPFGDFPGSSGTSRGRPPSGTSMGRRAGARYRDDSCQKKILERPRGSLTQIAHGDTVPLTRKPLTRVFEFFVVLVATGPIEKRPPLAAFLLVRSILL